MASLSWPDDPADCAGTVTVRHRTNYRNSAAYYTGRAKYAQNDIERERLTATADHYCKMAERREAEEADQAIRHRKPMRRALRG